MRPRTLELELFVVPTMVGNVGVLIAMSNIIDLSVPSEELGIQTGMNQTLRNLGSAVGPVLAAAITASFTVQADGSRLGVPSAGPRAARSGPPGEPSQLSGGAGR